MGSRWFVIHMIQFMDVPSMLSHAQPISAKHFDPLHWFVAPGWLVGLPPRYPCCCDVCFDMFWLCTSGPIVGRKIAWHLSVSFCVIGCMQENCMKTILCSALRTIDRVHHWAKPLLQGLPAVYLEVVQLCQFEWHNHHVLDMSAPCYRIKSISITYMINSTCIFYNICMNVYIYIHTCKYIDGCFICFILYMLWTNTLSNDEDATWCNILQYDVMIMRLQDSIPTCINNCSYIGPRLQ